MKWILIVVGSLVALVVIVLLIGAMVPVEHVASRSATFNQRPEVVWEAISDFEGTTAWRSAVESMERLPDQDGHAVWRENGSFGPITYAVEELAPPSRMVMRIADPDLPFGGRWIYQIEPTNGGSRLTITENGEIHSPLFRFMARFVFGYTATMENYLEDLGEKFGDEVVREPG